MNNDKINPNGNFQLSIILDTYKTIETASEGLYKEKGSKFLSFAQHVETKEEALEIVKDFRKRFFDARHVCYAYMIGAETPEFRANDDGEPSGTAGKPILGRINSNELTDILIIVVRYFGGVLLGTSGLTVAYREAAAAVIDNATIVEKVIEKPLTVHYEYAAMNEVMKTVKDFDARIITQKFEIDCMIEMKVRKSNFEMLKNRLTDIKKSQTFDLRF